jgi:hypothetical protein
MGPLLARIPDIAADVVRGPALKAGSQAVQAAPDACGRSQISATSYAQLYSWIDGASEYNDYTYTAQ